MPDGVLDLDRAGRRFFCIFRVREAHIIMVVSSETPE